MVTKTFTLSNGILELEIAALGAELRSLRRVASPHEYIWQGDPSFWDRRAPILFPIVGKVWQNTAHIDGRDYTLTQHGFARDMVFEKVVDEDRHMAFVVHADDESQARWPFRFRLRIDYTLLRNVITIGWTVSNLDSRPMPFQIGAHPGFMYPHYKADDPVHGYLSFDAESPLKSTTIVPGGFAGDSTFDVPLPSDGLLPLTNSTFECDTIVDATGRIRRVTLHDKNGRPIITVRHSMPITALWSPASGQAPFMCIEPWHGCCDPEGFTGEFSRKPFIESVGPGASWTTHYDIIVE